MEDQIKNHMPVFRVEAVGSDRNHTVAYAQGAESDIRKFYKDKEGYGLELRQIKINYISYDMAHEKENLMVRKQKLEKELKQIEEKLNGNV